MKLVSNIRLEGERPLYREHSLRLEGVTIGEGESALKESSDIEADGCRFEGRYPFWECTRFALRDSVFTPESRAALWYSQGMLMEDSVIDGPKSLREMTDITLRRVRITSAAETFWNCRGVKLEKVAATGGDYMFMHSSDIEIDGLDMTSKYSFQYCRNIVIRNSVLHTKDAFWETENVTVYDSTIIGEYLAWYSKNLRLVNCRIGGTQPLCYCSELVLENCTMLPDADLAFEYSEVKADVRGSITSVKNPLTGRIVADGYGEIIMDENAKAPADCEIEVR